MSSSTIAVQPGFGASAPLPEVGSASAITSRMDRLPATAHRLSLEELSH